MLFGPRDNFQTNFLAVTGASIEVVFERSQAMVFNTDRLAFDLTGTVATLVHQHIEHTAAANLRKVTGLGLGCGLLRAWQPRAGRPGLKQP
ncbi:hypothetical protein D3C72_1662070 [compost metagenome]